MDIINARAIVTLGVPEPKVIRKSGILFPFTLVLCNRYAIIHEITIPKNAAASPAIILFLVELSMEALENTLFHALIDILERPIGFPMFTVKEVSATVTKGKITTKNEKIEIMTVIGILHFPSSTMFGLVDFPLIVMYCLFPITKVVMYKTIFAIAIRNTASTIASLSPSSEPI